MAAVSEPPTRKEDTPASVAARFTHEAIALCAYFHYTHRGFVDGFALDDWLEAERELRQETKPEDAAPATS